MKYIGVYHLIFRYRVLRNMRKPHAAWTWDVGYCLDREITQWDEE